MCSQNDYNSESPVISVGGGPEDRDDDLTIRYDNQDVSSRFYEARGRSNTSLDKCVNNSSSRKKSKVKEPTEKRPRLENSKRKSKQTDVTHSKQKTKPNKISKKSAVVFSPPSNKGQPETFESSCSTYFSSIVDSGFAESCTTQKPIEATTKNAQSGSSKNTEKNCGIEKNSETYDGGTESDESNNSTYFSEFENDGCDPREVENEPTKKKSRVQMLSKSTSINSSTHKVRTPYHWLFLHALAHESFALGYMKTPLWNGTEAKKAVDDFVQLAESNSEKANLKRCKTEAIKTLQEVYERFLKSSNSLDKSTQWSNHFMILQTLCDSKNICEEFIKFFTSHMITPKSTTDLEDPKEIIERLAEHEKASFGLIQLHNVLRKYVKMVQESDCESNICSEHTLDFQLLKKFNEYGAKNSYNFPELHDITMKNIALLESRKNSGTSSEIVHLSP